MHEIRFTISEIPESDYDAFVQHLTNFVQEYDPNLQIHISVSEPSYWLNTKRGHYRVYYSECRFIETENRNLLFHCETGIIRKTGKISAILKDFPNTLFFRCNNSYIVNLHYINEITPEGERYNIRLRSGEVIPLSRNRYQDCLTALKILRSS